MCRAATITIPPSLYVKNKSNETLEAALDELLSKHNLSADSSECYRLLARLLLLPTMLLRCCCWTLLYPAATPSLLTGEKAVAKVKARLTTARELEGIDTSNIIEGGRRPRAAAQAARANYAAMASGAGSDDESIGEGSSSSSSEDEDASVDAGDRRGSTSALQLAECRLHRERLEGFTHACINFRPQAPMPRRRACREARSRAQR